MKFIGNILLVLFLFGCSSEPQVTMRVGTNTWPGYEPLYLAKDLKYFNDKQFRLMEHTSATKVIQSYRNNLIDAAALTLDEVLLLKQEGFDPRVVLVMDVSHGGDVIIAQNDIVEFKQLKGKKVGVEKGALGSYVLARALEINGMKPSDIQSIDIELTEHESAFVSRKVDAIVTFEPVRTRLLYAGGRQVFDSKMIPNEIFDVLVVKGEFLEKHPATVQALLKHWFKARDFLETKPAEAAIFISKRHNLTPENVIDSYDGLILPGINQNNTLLFPKDQGKGLISSVKKLNQVMKKRQLLKKEVDLSTLFKGLEKVYPLTK